MFEPGSAEGTGVDDLDLALRPASLESALRHDVVGLDVVQRRAQDLVSHSARNNRLLRDGLLNYGRPPPSIIRCSILFLLLLLLLPQKMSRDALGERIGLEFVLGRIAR